MTKITDNTPAQSSKHADHELWRIIKSWELLQDSQEISPDDLADNETDTLIKLERRVATYTPKTIEGLQLKSLLISHDYDETNSEEDEKKYTDCALIKSLFRNIETIQSKEEQQQQQQPKSTNNSSGISFLCLEPYIRDLERLTRLVLDAEIDECSKDDDLAIFLAGLAEEKAKELTKLYYAAHENSHKEKQTDHTNIIPLNKAAS